MRILRDYQFVNPADRGASVAIGNFDGVHLGHQYVIDLARKQAETLNAPLGVVCFEPHPRQYFSPSSPPFRLMNATARAHRLEKLGVQTLCELNFNQSLSTLSPDEFIKNVLGEHLGIRHAVIGADFRFGQKRAGDAQDFQRIAQEIDMGVTIATLMENDNVTVSSTAIRQALSDAKPRDAAKMLGHWHRMDGTVIRGDQRGRELGFPTANMSISGLHPPKFGVYVVEIDILTGPYAGCYKGAASIGTRPMFGENQPNLESYIFDFKGDIYGEEISVALVDYLRPEQVFENLDALINQMNADCATARNILAEL